MHWLYCVKKISSLQMVVLFSFHFLKNNLLQRVWQRSHRQAKQKKIKELGQRFMFRTRFCHVSLSPSVRMLWVGMVLRHTYAWEVKNDMKLLSTSSLTLKSISLFSRQQEAPNQSFQSCKGAVSLVANHNSDIYTVSNGNAFPFPLA